MSERYRTIVADPPWPYSGEPPKAYAPNGRFTRETGRISPLNGPGTEGIRYRSMTMDDLLALRPPAAADAHLYLWTTNSFMDEAHDVCRAWGFTPKTICTWGKVQPDGRPSMKTGYYFRGATEHVLFGVRGSLRLQTTEGMPTLWLWPRLPHSVKPDAFYDLVEKCSPGPRLEMFARRARFGWDYWGDESLGTAAVSASGLSR